MGFDIPDIHKEPVHLEQKQKWEKWFEKTLGNINSKLALDWLKVELPKTKEEQEKEVLELVKIRWLRESFEENVYNEWITVNKINDWVFSVVSNDTWNVNYFVNEKWYILFWVWNITERLFVENWDAYKIAWYTEKKEDWKFNMYKNIWKNQLDWPIDINSPEYYKAWTDIVFYADYLNKLLSLKHNFKESKIWIQVLVDWWSFKFEDLEEFKKRWLITPEIFDYWVQEMRKVIVNQCSDKRLINLKWLDWKSSGIKESDLRRYLEKWYITPELAQDCYRVLPKKMRDLNK